MLANDSLILDANTIRRFSEKRQQSGCVWWFTTRKTGVNAVNRQHLLGLGRYATAWKWHQKPLFFPSTLRTPNLDGLAKSPIHPRRINIGVTSIRVALVSQRTLSTLHFSGFASRISNFFRGRPKHAFVRDRRPSEDRPQRVSLGEKPDQAAGVQEDDAFTEYPSIGL